MTRSGEVAQAAAPPAAATATPSVTRRRRRVLGLLVLLGCLLAVVTASIAVGARPLGLGQVWSALVAPSGGEADVIVRSLRVPRTVLGVLVGGALAVGGALMQGHTRNPIADPGILGITYGAALAVVVSVFVLGVTSLLGYVWFAFAGAAAASLGVLAVGWGGRRGPTPVTLALAGAAMTALLNGVTSAIVLLDEQSLEVFRFWRVGSLTGRPAGIIWQVLPFLLAGLALALAGAPGLNALALGEDVARSLGQRVARARAAGVLAITLLVGASVAACGPIGFVGLIVPHLARAITGPDYRWLLPYAGLLGAVLLVAADVLGRVVVGTGEVEVGIVIAVLVGPFFVVLVRRGRMVSV